MAPMCLVVFAAQSAASAPAPAPAASTTSRKKESILNLQKHMDKEVRVKMLGGREGTARERPR